MKSIKRKLSLQLPHRQLNLFKKDLRFFGGQLLHGKRKSRRPLSTKAPMHLVLRSSWARGETSFLRPQNKKSIETLISAVARKYGVTLYQRATASNHLHLLLRIECRKSYRAFIRVLSSKIALHIMRRKSFQQFKASLPKPLWGDGGTTTEPQGKGQAFWQFRPFHRVLFWGRDFNTCKRYVLQNTLEAIGFLDYAPRTNSYAQWITASLSPPAG